MGFETNSPKSPIGQRMTTYTAVSETADVFRATVSV